MPLPPQRALRRPRLYHLQRQRSARAVMMREARQRSSASRQACERVSVGAANAWNSVTRARDTVRRRRARE